MPELAGLIRKGKGQPNAMGKPKTVTEANLRNTAQQHKFTVRTVSAIFIKTSDEKANYRHVEIAGWIIAF